MLVDLGNYTGSRLITQHLVGFCRRLPSSITAIFRKSVLSTWVPGVWLETSRCLMSLKLFLADDVPHDGWHHNLPEPPTTIKWRLTLCVKVVHPAALRTLFSALLGGFALNNIRSHQIVIHIKSYKLIHKKHQIIPNPYKSPRDVLS